jgi:hypothetical protein
MRGLQIMQELNMRIVAVGEYLHSNDLAKGIIHLQSNLLESKFHKESNHKESNCPCQEHREDIHLRKVQEDHP